MNSTTITTHAVPPPEHSIEPRPVRFNITDETPRHWFADDPFRTHFFNAFFTTFPPGEQFFVRSVMHFRDQVKDPALLEQITAFAGQEGTHANAHQDHLDILTRQGYKSLERENKIIDAFLKFTNRYTPKFALAMTVALEHFTAMLAHQALIEHELFRDPAHPDFIPLFDWHAAEEIEHKAVAFDVYQAVDGSYWRRILAIVLSSIFMFLILVPVRMSPLLFRDGVLFKWRTWRNGLPFLYGRHGKFIMPWRHYLQFYRRDFHPWDVQDFDLVRQFRNAYESGQWQEANDVQAIR
ncbi:MAG: metal-dependent hydrolase [Pseudomonadota bacterium]|nr:metal-dependent hydrolase [Pseudomonadota bacterium]